MLRWLTAGESHGPALVAMIEGLPAGVEVGAKDLQAALSRRRLGYGRGARMAFEQDEVEFLGGLRHGVTLGSPLAVRIGNSEWPKWTTVMSPEAVSEEALAASDDVNAVKEVARNKPLTRPRPGHADLVGMQKYGHEDARPVLERASARETAARVALGEVAARFLEQAYGIRLVSHTVSIGTAGVPARRRAAHSRRPRASRRRPGARLRPPGVGRRWSPRSTRRRRTATPSAEWSRCSPTACRRASARTSTGTASSTASSPQALMSIQAIKGVEVGDGFETARRRGSLAHDEMELVDGVITRRTGRAGGTEGGMSTGQVLRVRAAMKPISTVPRALATVDVSTGEAATAIHQRSDVCAVPAAGVVAEAMVALVLAQSCLEKFGGDSVTETARNHAAYLDGIREGLRTW